MRHTPGPWAVDNADPYLVTADGDGLMVAVTENEDRQDKEAGANARLIAAAPELHDFIATLENDDGKIPDWLWKIRNELLAKVRGEDGAR